MDYNKSLKYNFSIADGGATYNSAGIEVLVNLFETLKFLDSQGKIIAQRLVTEKISLPDFMALFVLQNEPEYFYFNESHKYSALFNLIENQGVSDVFSNLLISLFLLDKQQAIDEIQELNAAIEKEEPLIFSDINTIEAVVNIADKYGLNEAQKILAYISQFDPVRVTDREPRKAVSDFMIGQIEDYDKAFDWIIPFEMKVNWRDSSIQVMPQTESSYIDVPEKDGSIIENTIYKNRLFSIVAYSELGLSIAEKEQLKRDIAQILDATKNSPKKLTFMASDTSFDVQYSGSADITEGPSFVKATIPFESAPYGYPLFDQEVFGTGLLVNDGDADSGCVNKISSGAVNPSFQMGTITYKWSGTVPANTTLYIDHNNYTCYLETVEGTRTNVIDKLTGEFQTIPKASSVAITAFGNTGDYLTTTLKEKILW